MNSSPGSPGLRSSTRVRIPEEIGTPTPLKEGGAVLLKLPIGNLALRTGPSIPLIPEPPGRSTVLRISNPKFLVTVGNDLGLKAHNVDRPDSVQDASPGWPELHLLK